MLNDGGSWVGELHGGADDDRLCECTMKKANNAIFGKVWLAEQDVYVRLRPFVPKKWFAKNVVLFADCSKM